MDIAILSLDGLTRHGIIVAELATAQALNPGMLCVPRGTGADLTATNPPQPGGPMERRIPAYLFRDRFTGAELAGITGLAYGGLGDATAQVMLLKIATASEGINLDSAETIGGLDYLIAKGKLTAGRKAEILA
ncbi:MAG: hypothetical protein Q8O79_00830 [Pseudomonadota bacterium]|nr:hypothetical protein [Pseudomonadota bacterium]